MKKFFYLLLLFPVVGKAQVQKIDNDSTMVYTRIVQMDSTSKLKLFARANEWFVKYADARSKSFISENQTGKLEAPVIIYVLVSKGVIPNSFDGNVYCEAKFIAKDNKYKITFANFNHIGERASAGIQLY